jgi:hypothetical protein
MGWIVLYVASLFAAMLGAGHLARRRGAEALRGRPDGTKLEGGTLESAVLALLGLLVAFTFSGAAQRFDERRLLIVQESNDIGTAWLRLDLVPEAERAAVRERFVAYVDARLALYRDLADGGDLDPALAHIDAAQAALWSAATSALHAGSATDALVLSALNTMFDTGAERVQRMRVHPPLLVYALLFAFAVLAAFLAAYGRSHLPEQDLLHRVALAAVIAGTVYVSLDLEHPRSGLLRIDDFDAAIVSLRETMDR